jgi:hypothetical protein
MISLEIARLKAARVDQRLAPGLLAQLANRCTASIRAIPMDQAVGAISGQACQFQQLGMRLMTVRHS